MCLSLFLWFLGRSNHLHVCYCFLSFLHYHLFYYLCLYFLLNLRGNFLFHLSCLRYCLNNSLHFFSFSGFIMTGKCLGSPRCSFLDNIADSLNNIFLNVILFLKLSNHHSYIFSFLSYLVSDLLSYLNTTIQYIFERRWRLVSDERSKHFLDILALPLIVDLVCAIAADRKKDENDRPEAAMSEGQTSVLFFLNKAKSTIC